MDADTTVSFDCLRHQYDTKSDKIIDELLNTVGSANYYEDLFVVVLSHIVVPAAASYIVTMIMLSDSRPG